MNKISQCPICNGRLFSEFLETEDYFLTKNKFSIVQCDDCGFKLTNPKPRLEDLPQYYDSTEYISHSNADKGLVNKIYQIVRKLALKSKVNLIGKYIKSGHVVDIGCGTGEFLNAMQQNKYEVTGVEPNVVARKQAEINYGLTVIDENQIEELNKSQFNVITLWHVLEHVYDLAERISQINELITSKGILIVAVPNPSSYDAKHYGKFWAAYDCPRHLYHFDHSAIKKLFGKYDFEVIAQRPMYFDSFYVSMLSEKYKHSKLQFLRGLIVGFISNFSAMLNQGNYSSIIYVLKQIKA